MPLKNKKGFTLVELVIAIVIITLLAVFLIPAIANQMQKANEAGVDVDLHSFYVAAKSTIIVSEADDITTEAGFISKLNEFLDPELRIGNVKQTAVRGNDFYLSNEKDPWKNNYRFFFKEIDGNYWVAFTSKGVGIRDGWIFEPHSASGSQKYSRDGIETYDNKYILILGFYSLDSIPPEDRPVDIPEILGQGDEDSTPTPNPDPSSPSSRKGVLLSFFMEEDDYAIEIESEDAIDGTNTELFLSNTYNADGSGDGYAYSSGAAGGYVDNWVDTYPGHTGLNTYRVLRSGSGSNTWGYVNWISGGSAPSPYYPSESTFSSTSLYSGGSVTASSFNDWLAEQEMTIESSSSTSETTTVTLNVGKNNKIQITFNNEDKIADDIMWFVAGSTVTIEAIPTSGYEFQYWRINGTVDADNPKTLTVYEDTDFTAKFRMALSVNGSGRLQTANGSDLATYVADNEFYATKANGSYTSKDGLWTYTVTDNQATLTKYNGANGEDVDVVIPNKIDGVKVVALDRLGFGIKNEKYNRVTIKNGISLEAGSIAGIIDTLYIGKDVEFKIKTSPNYCTPFYYYNSGSLKDTAYVTNLEVHSNLPNKALNYTTFKNVVIGSEVTSVGTSTFNSNSNTETIYVDQPQNNIAGVPWGATSAAITWKDGGVYTADGTYTSTDGLWTYAVSNNWNYSGNYGYRCILQEYKGPYTEGMDLVIPSEIDNVKITHLSGARTNGLFAKTFGKVTVEDNVEMVNTYDYGDYIWPFNGSTINQLVLDSDKEMGKSFYRKGITKLDIGPNVNTISSEEFSYNELNEIPDLSNVSAIGDRSFNQAINSSSKTDVTIAPNTNIGEYAFSDCTMNIGTLRISEGTTVGKQAFGLSYANYDNITIDNLIIEDNCTIDSHAFVGCNITNLYVGDISTTSRSNLNSAHITTTKNLAEYGGGNDPVDEPEELILKSNGQYTSNDGLWGYYIANGYDASINHYYGNYGDEVDLNIPKYIDGSKVTGISASLALTQKEFGSISIPTEIEVPDYVFRGIKVNTLNIGDECYLCEDAFKNASIGSLYIGKNVGFQANSERNAFSSSNIFDVRDAAQISRLEIHSNIIDGGFQKCGLTSLIIGNEVTKIGANAFRQNSGLSNATIQNTEGSITIGSDAFPTTTTINYTGT